jgi:hypothetical protein
MSLQPIDNTKFYNIIIHAWGPLTQPQVDGINNILLSMQADNTVADIRHFAYMFATVKHETANTYQPIEEYGHGHNHPYGIVDPITLKAYYGRGYVQLTWKINYSKMAPYVGVDLINHPELALDPAIAYKIMSRGMVSGMFTGRKLLDYINPKVCDYVGARHIINGSDRATLIAGYATIFEKALRG